MDTLKLAPEKIAGKVKKNKPTDMDIIPLLISYSGRIGRSQFLKWYIPIWLLPIVALIFDITFGGYVYLAMLWPEFALTTKRSHDLGHAGWIGLFQLIPGIGGISITFASCGMIIGDFNDNKYGKSIYKK